MKKRRKHRNQQKNVYFYCVKLYKQDRVLRTWPEEQDNEHDTHRIIHDRKNVSFFYSCVKVDQRQHIITTWDHEKNNDGNIEILKRMNKCHIIWSMILYSLFFLSLFILCFLFYLIYFRY